MSLFCLLSSACLQVRSLKTMMMKLLLQPATGNQLLDAGTQGVGAPTANRIKTLTEFLPTSGHYQLQLNLCEMLIRLRAMSGPSGDTWFRQAVSLFPLQTRRLGHHPLPHLELPALMWFADCSWAEASPSR